MAKTTEEQTYVAHYAQLDKAGVEQLAHDIARLFVPELPQADDDERTWRFVDALTQREFEVRRSVGLDTQRRMATRYFLCEYVPNGIVVRTVAGREVASRPDARVRQLEEQFGPNSLYERLAAAGVDIKHMVRTGSGYSIDSVYHASLPDCARAVAQCLARNERYTATREATHQETLRRRRQDARQCVAYWQERRAQMDQALASEHGLFRGCMSMLGPLTQASKDRLLAYLNAPSQEGWLDVRGLVVTGHGTLWQAWCESDPRAPRSGNEGFPSPEQLQEAIRHAVQACSEEIDRRLAEMNPTGLSAV